jgi:Methylamine utilisation protein MauE
MNAVVSIANLVLALAFAVAAVAKLAERTSFRQALPAYGVPLGLVGAATIGIPLAELTVAVTLVVTDVAPWGAIAALTLLAIFTAAAAVARMRGLEADCRCFGPVDVLSGGVRPFVRNGALAAIAALAAVAEIRGASTKLPAAGLTGVALPVAGLGIWLAVSARRRGEQPATPPAVGSFAPTPVLRALTDEIIHLRASDGRQTLLVFASPSCPACQYLLSRLKAWEKERPPGSPRLIIASSGSAEENRAARLASPIVLEQSDEARAAFAIPGRPAAVLIDGDGRVASETILGAPAILATLGAPLT